MQNVSGKVQIRVLKGRAEELTQLQQVFEQAPDYAHRITGYLPRSTEAENLFKELPPNKTSRDKYVFGIYLNGEMVGCIDIVRSYPDKSTVMLGLFLISEKFQGKGIGTQAFQLLEDYIFSWKECQKIRIGVALTNDIVLPFWKKMDFSETGEKKPFKDGNVETEVILLEREL